MDKIVSSTFSFALQVNDDYSKNLLKLFCSRVRKYLTHSFLLGKALERKHDDDRLIKAVHIQDESSSLDIN